MALLVQPQDFPEPPHLQAGGPPGVMSVSPPFGEEAKAVLPGMLPPSHLCAPSKDWHTKLSQAFTFSAHPSLPPTTRLLGWVQAQWEIQSVLGVQ